MRIRRADETATTLALLDKATRWLLETGRPGQWGEAVPSRDARRIAMTQRLLDGGGLYLAWKDGSAVGALAVGKAPEYVSPATEPELYLNLLVTDRDRSGEGIGAALIAYAEKLANGRLLRVDCYRGDDRALVRYYESQGFTATEEFTVDTPRGPWPGQVLTKSGRFSSAFLG